MAKKKIKRSVSRIVLPDDTTGAKLSPRGFRPIKEVNDLLDKEQNISDTINKALLAYYGKSMDTCPTCKEIARILKKKKVL